MKSDRYLITGATGLIGSALVKKLYSEKNTIVCPIRNLEKVHSIFSEDLIRSIQWIEAPLDTCLNGLSGRFDYIIHCASPTASKFFIEHPVETMRFNIETTTELLEYSVHNPVRGMVFLSSLESYGTVLDDSQAIKESYQGYVNPFEARSSYNMAKRMCESLCHAYAKEYGVPVKVIRLTQTISPDIRDDDMRVFAQFARKAAKGEDIELHTEGETSRQYLYIEDAVDAIICVLLKGDAGEVYNAAREDSYISIRDLAQFVQDHFNKKGKVLIKSCDNMGYAPVTKLRLSTEKLECLGWKARYGLYEMFNNLIARLKENQ